MKIESFLGDIQLLRFLLIVLLVMLQVAKPSREGVQTQILPDIAKPGGHGNTCMWTRRALLKDINNVNFSSAMVMETSASAVNVFNSSFWVTVVHSALMLLVMLESCEWKKISLLWNRMMAGVRPSSCSVWSLTVWWSYFHSRILQCHNVRNG